MENKFVAIMAGGIGSRFWPKSRVAHPKQFIDILGVGKTLIQLTYERFLNIVPKENIYVVTNDIYYHIVKEQLPELTDNQILCEPSRKNTAPCIAYVANKIKAIDPKGSMIVAPSDHIVLKESEFKKVVEHGMEYVSQYHVLLTLGIVPTRPDTGYGYIQFDEESANDGIYSVKTFTEKPNLELAKQFIKSGDFLWNAGIFIWKVEDILQAFEEHLHDMWEIFNEGSGIYNKPEEKEFIMAAYSQCTNVSIDYGIMEKAENVQVIPADIGWSDLGTWQSLYEKYDKDASGNAINGEQVMVLETNNSMVMVPNDKLVVLQGLNNMCVVDTGDVLLICHRDREQEIKQITTDVKKLKDGERYL
ncbi:MAG: mannose-1-phosphate guanylyltransferase [Chitinophagales bacterium]|nr:mannose-1-phosphate guanylyltransferase [Chitinophagales bacterium]